MPEIKATPANAILNQKRMRNAIGGMYLGGVESFFGLAKREILVRLVRVNGCSHSKSNTATSRQSPIRMCL